MPSLLSSSGVSSIITALASTNFFLAASGSELSAMVAGWGVKIAHIEAAGRAPAVLAYLQEIPGLEKLLDLQTLTEPRAEWPQALMQERVVRAVDHILSEEIGYGPLYDTAQRPDLRLHRLTVGQARDAGLSPQEVSYFRAIDPRLQLASITVNSGVVIRNSRFHRIGNAWLCAGGAECENYALSLCDSSFLSGSTSRGGRTEQQDALYMSYFRLPNGLLVKVLAGADGAGGHKGGEIASSIFLQGVHAAVVDAAIEGTIPEAGTLFAGGKEALLAQLDFHSYLKARGPTATGVVIVIVGNTALLATVGDSMAALLRRQASGRYAVKGYAEVEVLSRNHLGNDVLHCPALSVVTDLQPDDRFIVGSDGFWENLIGYMYKFRCCEYQRLIGAGTEPDQALFHNLRVLAGAPGSPERQALMFHNFALRTIDQPGSTHRIGTETILLPAEADEDNILVLDYRHGDGIPSVPVGIPGPYRPLNPVPT